MSRKFLLTCIVMISLAVKLRAIEWLPYQRTVPLNITWMHTVFKQRMVFRW